MCVSTHTSGTLNPTAVPHLHARLPWLPHRVNIPRGERDTTGYEPFALHRGASRIRRRSVGRGAPTSSTRVMCQVIGRHSCPSQETGTGRRQYTARLNAQTKMCSGSEAGSYLRLIDFVYHSTLGLTVIKKRKCTHEAQMKQCKAWGLGRDHPTKRRGLASGS